MVRGKVQQNSLSNDAQWALIRDTATVRRFTVSVRFEAKLNFPWPQRGQALSYFEFKRDRVQMKIIINYRVLRAQNLARKGEYTKAIAIARKLLSHQPRSVGFSLLLADIELYSGNLPAALMQYEKAKELMDLPPYLSKNNKRFLAAYANFRITAVKFHSAGKEWPNWKEYAKLIEDLDADKRFKRVFSLPR